MLKDTIKRALSSKDILSAPLEKIILKQSVDASNNTGHNRQFRGLNFKDQGWHVYVTFNKQTQFVTSFQDQFLAALTYDVMSIQCRGLDARTNFNYRLIDVISILTLPNILDFKLITNLK